MSPDYVLLPLSSLRGIQHQSLKDYFTIALPASSPKHLQNQTNKILQKLSQQSTCDPFLLIRSITTSCYFTLLPTPLAHITRHMYFSSKQAARLIAYNYGHLLTMMRPAGFCLVSLLLFWILQAHKHRSWRANNLANLWGCPTSAQRRCGNTHCNLATVMTQKPRELPRAKNPSFTP